jgi:chromosome segregation ATPase
LKPEALERVLEALSPTLAGELDRVIHETREAAEREFQSRLEANQHEAERTAQQVTARAVDEAKEEVRREVTAELEQQFLNKLETTTAELRKESTDERGKLDASIEQLKQEWSAERAQLQQEVQRWRAYAEAQQQLSEASSQPEILARFLALAQPFVGSIALYVARADGLALWKSRGEGVFPNIISQQTTDPESYFRTISVRGKIVGAIYATPFFKARELDFLTASLERAVEAFGLKLRAAAPSYK